MEGLDWFHDSTFFFTFNDLWRNDFRIDGIKAFLVLDLLVLFLLRYSCRELEYA